VTDPRPDDPTRAQDLIVMLGQLRWTNTEAAHRLGVSETTIYRYRRQARIDDGEQLTPNSACQPSLSVIKLAQGALYHRGGP